ncbi:MAG: DUF3119 family protein [Oscillatoriales cyanobacterium RM2_1_1]|nr:DUF3119 family protein [Oscillatoriales cyanobacterium SM2_3_0]NJO44812.1 DUF3119 family protein [Oscillatoriales cyanobacterium RM2_1_1]
MTTTPPSTTSTQIVELPPSYLLPAGILLGGLGLTLIQLWLGLTVAIFGLFLMIQTATIRLQFTEVALDVYRSGKLIRNFPYQDWLNWDVFWPPVPILFYFKEVNSIHFLPMLFNADTLQACLQERCGNLKANQTSR